MSLILKGIDMPKETDGLSITFHSQDGVTETHILDATQAIQIPKDHGRLKDEKDVRKVIRRFIGYLDQDMINRLIVKLDIDAPTILESEE